MSIDRFIQKELNDEQRRAVTEAQGPLLVIAGAGSGKTRVITSRIAHLMIKHQAQPHSIVALTFTNKAAKEMLERVKKFLLEYNQSKNSLSSLKLPFIGTFHSYCLRLLRENKALLNLNNFTIMDTDDQLLLIKKIIEKQCPKRIVPRQALYVISSLKNNLHARIDDSQYDPIIKDIYTLYEREKTLSNCFDFDDLLLKGVGLFQNKTFKSYFQQTIKHILVDEYQDTSTVQHAFLKEMALDNKKFVIDSLCAVGDEDQSIYSWRGATVDNIVNFHKDFPKTKRIKIEQNYRSAKPILDAANSIIKHNSNRHPKNLWSTRPGSQCITHLTCMSGFQEADIIAQGAKLLQKQKKLQDAAVLYRTHFQSRLIEEALLKQSIPYKIVGGIQFYERKEIKDMLAYLRILINPYDRVAFQRIINCPPRRLGNKFVEQFLEAWNEQPFFTYHDVAKALFNTGALKTQQAYNMQSFLTIFKKISPETCPSKALEQIAYASTYFAFLKDEYEPQEAESRIENIQELINAARHFEEKGLETIEQFLQEVALVQDHAKKDVDNNECIQLMTLHAAKGLEFDTVFLTGLEEGLLPSSRSLENESAIEEERRLLYVGTTRARNKLLFLQAEFRHSYGKQTYQLPSRFLQELPTAGIMRENCTFWKIYQISSFLQRFFGIHIESTIQTFGTPRAQTKNNAQPSKKIVKKTPKITRTPAHTTTWKLHHPVTHKVFGVGIIKDIERRPDGSVHITATFKAGIKKIKSTFLQQ